MGPLSSVDAALATAARTGVDRLDAQLLLLHAWGKPSCEQARLRAWLIAHGEDALPEPVQALFASLLRRRVGGEPLAYLTGRREFFGLDLMVDPRVLVPRPDTELLVDWALEVLDAQPPRERPATVLDLGTGSGAVALAIKHARPTAQVDAVDASAQALAVARANANRLGVDVRLIEGDWLQPVQGRYDCIVSNPPYVAADDPHLAALRHEPLGALVAGPDGLQDLRRIAADAAHHLHGGGWLLLEHGHDQGPAARALMTGAGFSGVSTRRDLAGHERCTGGRVIAGGPPPMVK